MWRLLVVLVVCLSVSSLAQVNEQPLLFIKGTVHAAGGGRAPLDTTMNISPVQARTVVNLKAGGAFELQALAARTYVVTVYAAGYAPVTRELEVDERGRGELGALVLTPLRRVKLSVALAHHGGLEKAVVEKLEARADACVVVRASDDSGCRAQVCLSQEEDRVRLRPLGGRLETVGAVTLAELLSGASRSSTVVDTVWNDVEVRAGWGAVLHHDDPFCRGVIRVDEVK